MPHKRTPIERARLLSSWNRPRRGGWSRFSCWGPFSAAENARNGKRRILAAGCAAETPISSDPPRERARTFFISITRRSRLTVPRDSANSRVDRTSANRDRTLSFKPWFAISTAHRAENVNYDSVEVFVAEPLIWGLAILNYQVISLRLGIRDVGCDYDEFELSLDELLDLYRRTPLFLHIFSRRCTRLEMEFSELYLALIKVEDAIK